ncbi:MAG: phosphoribosyl-ATP diphosphatase [Alphaproteobacteria bacterium]|nr:phosphoribosyl-ATP diphosphatase [Alphaproteobacteria bacterium]
MTGRTHPLDELYRVIASRRGGDPDASYTARLLVRGTPEIARKLGEEAVETMVEALSGTPDGVAAESADLLYHLLVLWQDAGIDAEQVWAILEQRSGMSGLEEKASRDQD